ARRSREAHGDAPDRRPHPDCGRAGECALAFRPHAAVRKSALRPALRIGTELLGAGQRQLLGAQRHHPHGAIHALLRSAGVARRAMLLFAHGLRGVSRLHLALGIMCYLAGPLWLLFMLTGTWTLWQQKWSGLTPLAVAPFNPLIHLSATAHALLVFGLAMSVIF